MAEPVENARSLLHFVDGAVAYAGKHVHQDSHPVHTHSFFEVATVLSGEGVHQSLAGDQRLQPGDVFLLRPGVWHGYDQCRDLNLFNCCFSADLMQRELAWTREDPLLGYLLWTGPHSAQRRGILTTRLDPAALTECLGYLRGLADAGDQPASVHRGEVVGWLSLFLTRLGRTVSAGHDRGDSGETHPAVLAAMRKMEAQPEHQWTLTELADDLHLAPGYLVRIFKSATGLPPMAYLSRHRVELAADRLLHTDQPISRIGESVGWPDQNYFARRFKSHYGLSASTYRQRFNPPRLTAAGR